MAHTDWGIQRNHLERWMQVKITQYPGAGKIKVLRVFARTMRRQLNEEGCLTGAVSSMAGSLSLLPSLPPTSCQYFSSANGKLEGQRVGAIHTGLLFGTQNRVDKIQAHIGKNTGIQHNHWTRYVQDGAWHQFQHILQPGEHHIPRVMQACLAVGSQKWRNRMIPWIPVVLAPGSRDC